ncbi:MAG TPA: L,D-transpeptidase [Pyrinomonadaceae bacterium]|nr:L,D-transpeptidase [Pyrinomonadaceae bacterium]
MTTTRAHTFRFAAVAALLAALLPGCGRGVPESARAEPAPRPLTAALPAEEQQMGAEDEEMNRRPLKLPLTEPKIVVSKRARRLVLYSAGRPVRAYRVVLGFAPEGDKVEQGDGRTPEGAFYVCMKNERSRFYLSLGLSYPDEEDAARGLRDGLITRAQHDRIARAIRRKLTPPWNTRLGGEIFIHGGGTASDWTAGCVALENEHIKELFDSVPLGAAVVINP